MAANLTFISSGVVEAEGIVAFRNIVVDDLPAAVIIPALSRVVLTDGNTIDDINASAILANSWSANYIRLFLDGVMVTGFPPLATPVSTTAQRSALSDILAAQTQVTTPVAAAPPTVLLAPGVYENATVVVGANGQIVSVNGGAPPSISGLFLSGDVVGALTSNQLIPTGVTPGTYTNATIVVDAKGRVSFAATGTSSGITPVQHEALRQLVHFVDNGPAKGFLSGAYREINPPAAILPLTVTWWDDVTMVKKIVEKTIVYAGVLPTTITWDVYDTDGVTILETIVDAIVYSGVFEINRTRTIV